MRRKGSRGLRLGLLAVLALPAAGCVQVQPVPYYGYYAPAAPIGPNAGAGAVAGGVAGGLLGAAASGPHDRGLGAVGGAAAGALVGGLIGSTVDRDNAAAAQGYGYQPPPGYAPRYHAPPAYPAYPPADYRY